MRSLVRRLVWEREKDERFFGMLVKKEGDPPFICIFIFSLGGNSFASCFFNILSFL